jgi:hypothetical protein
MRKLEDIPRKAPFKVPDGYFDQFPTIIQARMAKDGGGARASHVLNFSLKFVLPLVALIAAGIFWLRPDPAPANPLDDVDTGQIALYLSDVEHLDLEETEVNGWTTQELDQLKDTIYSNMEYSNDEILNDMDLDNL